MGFDPDGMNGVTGLESNSEFDFSETVLVKTLYSFVLVLEIFKDRFRFHPTSPAHLAEIGHSYNSYGIALPQWGSVTIERPS